MKFIWQLAALCIVLAVVKVASLVIGGDSATMIAIAALAVAIARSDR